MSTVDKNTIIQKEIDLIDLGKRIWSKKWFIGKISLLGMIIGIIIAFSIPKEYTSTVVLTPESSSSGGNSGMGTLAAMAGINLSQNTQDAISPDLYPNILGSTPFLIGLFDIKVKDENKGISSDLFTYLKDDQKQAWWSYVLGAPSKLLTLFLSKKDIIVQDSVSSKILDLSPEQSRILEALKSRIGISVDKKTGTITLSSTMQSPEISAYIADTVTSYLQTYIIDYRTQKARQDLMFTEKLYEEAKNEYYKAQKNYATYSDENLDIISARYGTTKERLQNEMTLAYGVYNQMAQQLQMAKVKVQDTTPVYTVIQPPVVPHIPEKPKKKLIVMGFFFITFLGSCAWIIVKDLLIANNNINS